MKSSAKIKGMIDTSLKPITRRVALAKATVKMSPQTLTAVRKGTCPKGNVIETARIAGIMAAKNTPQIIPLCHSLELSTVTINFSIDTKKNHVTIVSKVICMGRTGVEMEALVAASAAALTIYDMMKKFQRNMIITEIRLLKKSGGKSGSYAWEG